MVVVDGRLLDGIGVIAAVVESGSFVRAGEALGMTQPGVSRAVARLERRLGVRLFDRTPRAVALTDEGRRFYEEVRPLLDRIEDAALEASTTRTAVRGRLRVSVDGAFGHYVLAPRITEFLTRYPELSFDLVVRDRIGDLVSEGLDVAVRSGEPESSSQIGRRLLETRVLTCTSPAYVARRGSPAHPRELGEGRHECMLVRDPTTGRPFGWEFHRAGEIVAIEPEGRLTVNDSASLIGAMLSGHGVGQPLEFTVRELLADGRLVQLLPEWAEERFPVWVYHRSRELPSAKVRAFLDFVFSVIER